MDAVKQELPYSYLGTDEELFEIFRGRVRKAAVCVGYLGKGNLSERKYAQLKNIGYELPTIMDSSAVVSSTAELGNGTFGGKGAIINTEVKIGKITIINSLALIEHGCVVGDFTHVAVATVLCGRVRIGEVAFIGANVTVIQGRRLSLIQ